MNSMRIKKGAFVHSQQQLSNSEGYIVMKMLLKDISKYCINLKIYVSSISKLKGESFP